MRRRHRRKTGIGLKGPDRQDIVWNAEYLPSETDAKRGGGDADRPSAAHCLKQLVSPTKVKQKMCNGGRREWRKSW